jgi:hypothetical protein
MMALAVLACVAAMLLFAVAIGAAVFVAVLVVLRVIEDVIGGRRQ